MHDDNTSTYRAFLLRYWQEQPALPDREPVWRLSLTDIAGEQREYEFVSLPELADFLRLVLMTDQPNPAAPLDSPPGDAAEQPTIEWRQNHDP
jgi:hypothetical protein